MKFGVNWDFGLLSPSLKCSIKTNNWYQTSSNKRHIVWKNQSVVVILAKAKFHSNSSLDKAKTCSFFWVKPFLLFMNETSINDCWLWVDPKSRTQVIIYFHSKYHSNRIEKVKVIINLCLECADSFASECLVIFLSCFQNWNSSHQYKI